MRRKLAIAAIVTTLALFRCSGDSGELPVGGSSVQAKAVFAGGCFWCMEPPFEHLAGVFSATSGYTGGAVGNPSYESVSNGGTGHYEAVEVLYDPARVSYAQLLNVYWRNIDPADGEGQFCDRGDQYRAAIFYANTKEQRAAEDSRANLAKGKGLKFVTEILPAGPFYPAEKYHQDFYRKNPVRYKIYRLNCGRDYRLASVWGSAGKQ